MMSWEVSTHRSGSVESVSVISGRAEVGQI
jgi:hypothetical protein